MRVLVTGGTGLLGRELVQQLLFQGHEVWVSIHTRPCTIRGARSTHIDWTSVQTIRESMLIVRPDVVYHCLVERRVDICEKNWPLTLETNVEIPTRLAQICEEFGSYLIHISTDYVFDGRRPPFAPTDRCNPCNAYGMSKLLSELRVQAFCPSAAIVRVPVLYSSNVLSLDECAVTVLGKKVMNQMQKAKEDGHILRRPIYIPDFCNYLCSLLHSRASGIQHYGQSSFCGTKVDIMRIIARLLQVGCEHISSADFTQAKGALRPYDTHLVDPMETIVHPTPLTHGLQLAFARWIHPMLFDPSKSSRFFLLLDLDGTLVNTDSLHVQCYKDAGAPLEQLDDHIRSGTLQVSSEIKQRKTELFVRACETPGRIQYLPGAQRLLTFCKNNQVNLCIVTNTSKICVEAMIKHLPELQDYYVKGRLLTREDYCMPKPAPDGYMTSYRRFYNGEPYVLGFENTYVGVQSLDAMDHNVCIYAVNPGLDRDDVSKVDCFMIPSLSWLWTRRPIA